MKREIMLVGTGVLALSGCYRSRFAENTTMPENVSASFYNGQAASNLGEETNLGASGNNVPAEEHNSVARLKAAPTIQR